MTTTTFPQRFQCPNCHYVLEYNPNKPETDIEIINGALLCPVCYQKFMEANIPAMQLVQDEAS